MLGGWIAVIAMDPSTLSSQTRGLVIVEGATWCLYSPKGIYFPS